MTPAFDFPVDAGPPILEKGELLPVDLHDFGIHVAFDECRFFMGFAKVGPHGFDERRVADVMKPAALADPIEA